MLMSSGSLNKRCWCPGVQEPTILVPGTGRPSGVIAPPTDQLLGIDLFLQSEKLSFTVVK